METSKSEDKSQAFVLTPEELQSLYALFPQESHMTLELKCRDTITRKFASLEEFLRFENPPNKEITELLFSVGPNSYTKNVTLVLSNPRNWFGTSVSYYIKGDEEYVTKMVKEVEERLTAMKPWYAWIAKNSWIVLVFLSQLYWMYSVVSNYQSSYTVKNLVSDIANASLPTVGFFVLASLVVLVVGTFVFNRIIQLMQFIFPMGVFAVGRGKKRDDDKERWRMGVVVAGVVSLITSVMAAYILR